VILLEFVRGFTRRFWQCLYMSVSTMLKNIIAILKLEVRYDKYKL